MEYVVTLEPMCVISFGLGIAAAVGWQTLAGFAVAGCLLYQDARRRSASRIPVAELLPEEMQVNGRV